MAMHPSFSMAFSTSASNSGRRYSSSHEKILVSLTSSETVLSLRPHPDRRDTAICIQTPLIMMGPILLFFTSLSPYPRKNLERFIEYDSSLYNCYIIYIIYIILTLTLSAGNKYQFNTFYRILYYIYHLSLRQEYGKIQNRHGKISMPAI